ncbi:MAG TPA: MmgE/PrpD family protein [Burkholderiales bacterium]
MAAQLETPPKADTCAPGLAQRFGALIADTLFEDLPPEALHWAKVGILDTAGVTVAGAREPCAVLLATALDSPPGPSALFGLKARVRARDAAMINGTASHALDFDDCNNTLGGHPSVPILPALFALADERKVSGREFVTAYVAGFEMETKLAMSVNFHHYMKGWHPTATLGVFGAAAACARLLGLDARQTAVALALAASSAAGIKANFGTMTKPFHVGRCASEGLLAAKMAAAGYTANAAGAFEHEHGFFEVYNGAGNYDPARGIDAWGSPWDIVRPGIAIKQYPCCGSTHPAVDTAIELAQQHQLKEEDIKQVEIWIHQRRLKHTNRHDPNSELDAKFSVQYVVARALLDASVTLAHFEDEAYLDARVRRLLPRVHAAPYTDAQFDPANHFGGEVHVHLRDGRVLAAKTQQPAGRTSGNPLSAQALRGKFAYCAAPVLGQAKVDAAYNAIQAIETLDDVSAIGALLSLE